MKTHIHHKPSILFLALCSIFSTPTWAVGETSSSGNDAMSGQLETIQIRGRRHAPRQLGRERLRREQLDREMVQDIRDMVRYDPGISVAEGGRAGSNGFSIRGVDKDRVAIVVDGLDQGESRSSSAFQELFGAYGNFNANRNAAEMEHMSEVTISKGADSITAGSGALGGAVIYRTKSPRDYVDEEKPYYVAMKTGYFSRSEQWLASITAAGRLGGFDALVVGTVRNGHETKNHDEGKNVNLNFNNNYQFGWTTYSGVARGIPDPQNTEDHSDLFRLGYHFNDRNYLSGIYETTRQDRETDELSNLFQSYGDTSYRYRRDVAYRRRVGLEYENLLEWGPWNKLTVNFDRQKIRMTTMTWDIPTQAYINRVGRNAENYFIRRSLNYETNQFKIAADKHFDLSQNTTWDMAYGIGGSRKRNTNNNTSYFSFVFYPDRLASNSDHKEFLVSTQSTNYNVYWNNTFRFSERFKLNLGVRYDRTRMHTLDTDSFNPDVKGQLEAKGIWNQQARFSAPSYVAALDWNISPSVTLQGKYSTGFRAPTTDEMWFYFPNTLFYVEPNPALKAERSKNFELGVDVHGNWGHVRLSGYKTRYSDFIDFVHRGFREVRTWNYTTKTLSNREYADVYQNENRSRADIKGVELKARWNLDSIGLPEGSYTTLAANYTKGEADGHIPINAIQPFNGVIGFGYQQPDNRWGVDLNISYFARKKPEDTIASYDDTGRTFPFVRHSSNIWLADLTANYQFRKHLTIRGGIYNLFNRRYYTWETLRSIREFGTVNRVDNQTHAGIERFSAPGRNFSLVIEAKF
ncbi:TonB-dependent hemoglobin/transferrin/lactoferrin family receptor [Eikenella sp. S3360]|uniref:TonB-dependent hemoglobin/transferrin/lactoferrin family receptor n=1 Tax=Eikenella glucosivorans TaxID=2766967 RepID=A0ABS0NB71_9NEIS|nr:TonB-dependent hemoglobin/transferrin/lactoferrin family receptor [Eikenella glucosivorans]MBH5329564.1 TonB-dependent hemoglobin/transferrin/lactoferrin family receptor [Eikenella glucosivorans]